MATGSISECSSKPVLVLDGTSNAYVVYSVVNGNKSTVFAVTFDGNLKWQVIVDGQIMGTPAVSNKAIYISHNVDSTTGYLSVLLFNSENNNDMDVPVLTATLAPTQGNAPLGPLSLDPESGQDVVAVAEWWDQGYGSKGNLYFLVFSEDYNQFGGRGNESYTMQHVSSWPFSASARPLVVDSSVWLGASGANIGGWQQKDISKVLTGERENVNPKWVLQLDTKTSDSGQPLLTTPVISDDESMLVLAGTNGELYGLQSKGGKQQWANMNGASAILAQPVIVEDAVYVIESQNGNVRQHSLWGGNEIWQLGCDSESPLCNEEVEADFGISPNGALLYYGDISGNIVALQIATVDTAAPTMVPTTLPPTRSPSSTAPPTTTAQESPTDGTSQNGQGNDRLDTSEDNVTNLAGSMTGIDDSDSTVFMIASAVGGFFVVVLATIACFILCKKRRNRKKNSDHKSASGDFGSQKPKYSQSSNRELDYGTPDKTTPVAPPKKRTPDIFAFDSDSEVGTANSQHLPSSNDSTRDLTDTFSLLAPSETDDGTLTNKGGMPSDASHMSEESDLPIPPPPTGPIPKQVETETISMLDMEAQKYDEATTAESVSYANMYADNLIDDLKLQSQPPVSPTSTVSESSVYTGQPPNAGSPANSVANLMSTSPRNVPVIPDVFSTILDRDALPCDEEGTKNSRQQFILSQSTKQPAYNPKHDSGNEDNPIPDDERMNAGPGDHYMSEATMDKNLYSAVAVRRDNSINGDGAKFGAPRQVVSSLCIGNEPDPKEQNTEKWSSFMSELEEAEKMFSEPNLKSSRMLADDESTDAGSSFMGLINSSMGDMMGSDKGI
ncbi:unnamed protein product [Cylindrotheca closterium]|uniref:Pyrrolo-quinoline quinone repeat domain-containing protein n=1 Tax=Cylindrotheca closterium TaxID=2856 RepID=A0AAD2FRN6_9STRA|nr:unnamed protein product [Cylindrotheca closterium]